MENTKILALMTGGWNKDVGNIERIYTILETLHENKNIYSSVEAKTIKTWKRHNIGKAKLNEGASISSHLKFCSQLGLVIDNQFLSAGGKTLLALNKDINENPKFFLLSQILERDRSCLLRFLSQIKESKGRVTQYERVAISNVFNDLRKIFPNVDIPELDPIKRGAWSHAYARIHFLKTTDLWDVRFQIFDKFEGFDIYPLPDNYFFLIGEIFGLKIKTINDDSIFDLIIDTYKSFLKKRLYSNYISAKATFGYINELSIRNNKQAINWNDFMRLIRTNKNIVLSHAFDPSDVLFRPKI